MTLKIIAFGIVMTAAAWSLAGFGPATGLTCVVFVVMALAMIRREHKLVETSRALRQSQHRCAQANNILDITLDNMSQGLILVEPSLHITVINRRARSLLELPESLLAEQPSLDRMLQWQWNQGEFGADGEALDPALRDVLRNGGLAHSPPVYVYKRPNGTVLKVRTMMLPSGGAVRTFADISEHHQTEEQLAAAKDAAEAGYRSKSAFLTTMSHEIRTPLNGVIGSASLLLDTELTNEQRKSVETIQECSDMLLDLINDVLDFSKLEAGRLELDRCEFDLIGLCEAVFKVVEPRARSKNLTLVLAPVGRPPARIVSDPARLRQVLLNLIGNAVKFTETGAVILRTSVVERGGSAQRLRFEVEDTGIGISAEARGRLFAEFSQVDASIARRYGGTGLGLAICKKTVAAMGGEIGAESEEGKGSLFWFELPFTASDTTPASLPSQIPAGLQAALIAADDAGRAAIETLLRSLGLAVTASDQPDRLGDVDVVFVPIHHPMTIDLIRGHRPAGAGRALFVGYGFGVLSVCSDDLCIIDGAVTPSSVAKVLAGSSLAGAQARQPRPAKPEDERASPELAILLVEDNPVNQRIAATMLTRMGHAVDVAGNGRDAVDKARARAYDVIVMDMQMPGMDGLETTHAIRQLPGPSGQAPIIAMTANAFATDQKACLKAGMNDFISKPITARKLFDAIDPWARVVTAMRNIGLDADIDASAGATTETGSASPETTVDRDVIDDDRLRTIRDEDGDDGLRARLIGFWADAADRLGALEKALAERDLGRAADTLNRLKDAAADLGLTACVRACDDLRATIAHGQPPDFNRLLTALFKTLQATQPHLARRTSSDSAAA